MDATPLLELLGAAGVVAAVVATGVLGLLHRDMSSPRAVLFWPLLLLALAGPVGVWILTSPNAFDESWTQRATREYESIWSELDAASLAAAGALEALDLDREEPLAVFRVLTALTERSEHTLLLLGPDGSARAWAGNGLLHDLESGRLPSTGSAYRTGFSTVTLASVRRVGGQAAAWRLIAGRSYSSQRLPFPSPSGGRRADYIWAVAAEGSRLPEKANAIRLDGRPTLSVLIAPGAPFGGFSRRISLLQVSWLALALAFLLTFQRDTQGRRRDNFSGLFGLRAIAGTTALAIALRLPPLAVVLLVASWLVAWMTYQLRSRRALGVWSWISAPLGVGLVIALGYRLEKLVGPVDLAATLFPAIPEVALRLTVFFIVLAGLMPATAQRPEGERGARRWLWIFAVGLLALGAVLADRAFAGGLCVLLASLVTTYWLRSDARLAGAHGALVLATIAALLAATTWQVSYRTLTARYLEHDVAPRLGPPSAEERETLRAEVDQYFRTFDLSEISAADHRGFDHLDLAYTLWTRSPLAAGGHLSSLAVVLDGETVSRFEFGVPLTRIGEVDDSPELWHDLLIPGWEEALISAQTDLRFGGRVIGTVEYALLPRPGFRLVTEAPEQLAATLVRGTLASRMPIRALVEPGTFAVYGERPRPAVGHHDSPALSAQDLAQPEFTTFVEGSRVRGWTFRSGGGTEVILLHDAHPQESLEKAGVQALGTLLALAALVAALMVGHGIRWSTVESIWTRLYRSYSNKLLLVYGTMLLVPLLAVTLALLGVLGDRLERTREDAGLSAMEAAQHVLGEYVLSLEPGFGVDTAIDDSLLRWLSRVVAHEVNLYWGSTLYASSSPELITAGLLPPRIPGEIYAQLSLESGTTAARVNRASGERYLELYAPLRIPGAGSQELLFLSIPLLAQLEEVQDEIAVLRTRAVLVALVLLVGVIATARRLSRGFTKPLTDLIAGTESIAAGARSLELQPTELELAALVAAINSMAGRIAETRERLMVEKQVVDKVVENIAAGVVSLDQSQSVLLCNEVAKDLLGLEIGQQLAEAVTERTHLQPLAEFLADPARLPRQRTLHLRRPGSEEREWTVVWVPVPGEGEPTSLLVIEDVTDVLRGQRLEAWAEMARMIAHEIKNPLTPIRLSTEHMVEVYARQPAEFEAVLERCSSNILRQVDELQQIASEFATYSRIPEIQLAAGDLVAAAEEIVESYRAAPPAGIEIRLETTVAALALEFDRRLLGRALRNLIENALRASRDGGDVVVKIRSSDVMAWISVEDSGPGADAETLRRMFDPYFSTDTSGTGLGLPISRRIVEEHGGEITARNRNGGGLEVIIALPLGGAPTEATRNGAHSK